MAICLSLRACRKVLDVVEDSFGCSLRAALGGHGRLNFTCCHVGVSGTCRPCGCA